MRENVAPITDAVSGESGRGSSLAWWLTSPCVSRPVSLSVGPGGPCSADGVPPVPSEAEETVSVGSCFASEDTTEDSGVMSSPSDIVSLDSQHDSTKSKDKWGTDQEDCSDQDLAGTPEPGPPRSPQWERSSSENRRLR